LEINFLIEILRVKIEVHKFILVAIQPHDDPEIILKRGIMGLIMQE
jgi:hypothetical protein